MKKTLAFIVFIVIILVGVVTCPQKDAHQDALMKLVNIALDTELSQKASSEEEKGWALLGSMIGSSIAELVIDNKLVIDNYFVYSIGRIVFEGEEKVVSVGLFNHVFTMSEDKLKNELENSL